VELAIVIVLAYEEGPVLDSRAFLARVNSSVPEGTRIVILSIFMLNDRNRGVSPTVHQSNVAGIRQQLARVRSGSSTRPA
jgi:hypothetical protein